MKIERLVLLLYYKNITHLGACYLTKMQWHIQRLIWAHRECEARAWENQPGVCKPPQQVQGRALLVDGERSPRKILMIYWLKSRF